MLWLDHVTPIHYLSHILARLLIIECKEIHFISEVAALMKSSLVMISPTVIPSWVVRPLATNTIKDGCVSSLIWVRRGHLHLSITFSVCIKKGRKKENNPRYLPSTNPPKVVPCSRRSSSLIQVRHGHLHLSITFSVCIKKKKEKKTLCTYIVPTHPGMLDIGATDLLLCSMKQYKKKKNKRGDR